MSFEKKSAFGTVDRRHDAEDWGVLVSPEVDGTFFAHFSVIEGEGYRSLSRGQKVEFRYSAGSPG